MLTGAQALLIIGLLAVGVYMTDLPEDAANKYDLYPIHKALGFIALMLVLVRIPVRFKSTIPSLPRSLENWEVRLSHLAHVLLYVGMVAMTVSGYFMNSTYPHVSGIDMFGLFTVPDITPKSEYWNGIAHVTHEYAGYAMIAAVSLHVIGVIKHRFFDKAEDSDVLQRML